MLASRRVMCAPLGKARTCDVHMMTWMLLSLLFQAASLDRYTALHPSRLPVPHVVSVTYLQHLNRPAQALAYSQGSERSQHRIVNAACLIPIALLHTLETNH